ncbi:MAG: hypothetical protein KDK23_09880 [Leptospiraceae bacterium]|nr:hypothetical protein [Leptospiraceae bacterium]
MASGSSGERPNWVQRLVAFLGYDEVSLFAMNFAFVLMLFTDLELVKSAVLVSFNPLFFVYGMSVVISIYLSLKHIWLRREKSTREVFFMVGGGGWLALSLAYVTLKNVPEGDWLSIAFAAYSFLYNLLILWFMGLISGLEIARDFFSDREAHILEAAISTALVAGLALFLRLYLGWEWWRAMNACIFYTLGVNKVLLGLWEQWQNRGRAAS